MSRDLFADRFTTLRWPYQSQAVRYVRSVTGNDLNDGLTPGTAWRTLNRALQSFAIAAVDHQWVLDLGSGDGTVAVFADATRTLNLGGTMLAGVNFSLDLGATGPDNFIARTSCQIRSSPIRAIDGAGPVPDLTVTGVVANATTGRITVTVAELLTVGAHVGQLLLGSGIGEWARIVSNTAHDLVITTNISPALWTAPISIYTEGAIIRYGDPAELFELATYLVTLCDWWFSGIAFKSTLDSKPSALYAIALAPTYFQMCSFDGISLENGGGAFFFDACYVAGTGTFYAHDGAQATWRTSLLSGLTPSMHGSSDTGTNFYQDCTFVGWTAAVGHGNTATRWSAHIDRCDVSGSGGDGIEFGFGNNRATSCLVHNNSKDGIFTQKHAWTEINACAGAANAGVGVRLESGAQVDASAVNTVTGAGGDVKLGGVVAAHAWGAGEATDLGAAAPQMCRIYGPGA